MTETITVDSQQVPVIDALAPSIFNGVLGERIDTKVMVYAPTNELGVIFLAGYLWDRLKISHIEQMSGNSFPDAIGVENDHTTGLRYKRVRIEFEHFASNFKLHKHPIDQCDIIICWFNDWKDCPIRVIELRDYIEDHYQKRIEDMKNIDKLDDSVRYLSKEKIWCDNMKSLENAWKDVRKEII
jgi:hypothetical protein